MNDDIQDFQPADPDAASEALLMAERYRNIFETYREGAIVLDDLMRRFSETSGAVLHGGIDAVVQTYYRSGTRAPIDHIIRQINRANGVT